MKGADKAMMMLACKPLVQHVIDRIRPQVDDLLINANGDSSRFSGFGCKVVPDGMADFPGPLAGILAGLQWTKENRPDADWLVSCACDCPFLPSDLVSRLVRAAERAAVPIAVAASGTRHHPVVAAWRTDLPVDADDVLRARGLRKVDHLIDNFANVRVEFSADRFDPFFNINTPEDLSRAEALIMEGVQPDA
jgi:molybdopterin-guanine dinucleotide biosynthesis protein A